MTQPFLLRLGVTSVLLLVAGATASFGQIKPGRDPKQPIDEQYTRLSRRWLQAAAKAKGLPWDTGKGFDHSAPVSELVPEDIPLDIIYEDEHFLALNKQDGGRRLHPPQPRERRHDGSVLRRHEEAASVL